MAADAMGFNRKTIMLIDWITMRPCPRRLKSGQGRAGMSPFGDEYCRLAPISRALEEGDMLIDWVTGLAGIGLTLYLLYALVRAERF